MSDYLNSPDSDEDNTVKKEPEREPLSEADRESILGLTASLKATGNEKFAKQDYNEALEDYTAAVNELKKAGLPKDVLILLNRSATYLALKRYVPAMNDANQGTIWTY